MMRGPATCRLRLAVEDAMTRNNTCMQLHATRAAEPTRLATRYRPYRVAGPVAAGAAGAWLLHVVGARGAGGGGEGALGVLLGRSGQSGSLTALVDLGLGAFMRLERGARCSNAFIGPRQHSGHYATGLHKIPDLRLSALCECPIGNYSAILGCLETMHNQVGVA